MFISFRKHIIFSQRLHLLHFRNTGGGQEKCCLDLKISNGFFAGELWARHGPAVTIVENWFGSPAILFLGGTNMNFEKLATSEAAVMNDPEDPSTFTFHKMKGRCMNIEYMPN